MVNCRVAQFLSLSTEISREQLRETHAMAALTLSDERSIDIVVKLGKDYMCWGSYHPDPFFGYSIFINGEWTNTINTSHIVESRPFTAIGVNANILELLFGDGK